MTRPAGFGRRRQGCRRGRCIRAGALLVACGLIGVACQAAHETGAPPDLVWAIGAIDAAPGGPAPEIADLWNQAHPDGPQVRLHALPPSADDQRQLMATELNAGLPEFDILTLDVVWTGEFAVNGWLADLQRMRSSLERLSLAAPLRSATWNGTLWGAPFTSDAGVLYYRTDLVDKPPTTWEELVRVGLAAGAKAGIAPFVGQGAQYEGMVVNYLEYLWGAGGDLFNAKATDVDFRDGPARQALEFMRDARQRGFYAKDFDKMKEEDARAAFQKGEAVFMRNWPYAYPQLKGTSGSAASKVGDRFGIAPLPTFDGKGTTAAIGGHNLAVSRFSDNRRAAEQFVAFASTNAPVQRLLAKKFSRGPAMASVYADPDLLGDPVMSLLGRVLKDAKPRPPPPEWSAISDEIQQNVFPAYTGALDPATAVKGIRSFLELTVTSKG